MSIGERIRLVRAKLSRAEFARKIDLNVATVRNYEEGLSLPNSETIAKLCDVFNLTPGWLVLGHGDMYFATGDEDCPPCFPQVEHSKGEIDELRDENRSLRLENRELRQENRELLKLNAELNRENRELLKENGDLRVALARLEPRGAPNGSASDAKPDEAARKSA